MGGVGFRESDPLRLDAAGLQCPAGGFHIDPWGPAAVAVITHAHADHARPGMGRYLCAASCAPLLRERVGKEAAITPLAFGEAVTLGRARLSLHPAGHILGSAQVRIEAGGVVAVVTGDHNATHAHAAAEPFTAVPCDLLVTESTFALPVYQWPEPAAVLEEIHRWWRANREGGRVSVLPCYPLGKTQRVLAGLEPAAGPVAVAGPARVFIPHYERAGVRFPPFLDLTEETVAELKGRGLVFISASGQEPALLRRLEPLSWGAASGWMRIRGVRRGRDLDRGFVLSDHSDWHGLLRCVRESGARRVGVTHGHAEVFARYLRERAGVEAFALPSRFEGDGD